MKFAICTHLFFRRNLFHFEEWLKYHIDFGVDHFYFYESSHSGIPCLQKDTKRQIDIPFVADIPYKDIYKYYDKIRERYKDHCTFIKWLPKDKNGSYLPHYLPPFHKPREQAAAFIHFYQNYAKKYDRVSTIDCDEFYFSKKYNSIKSFLDQNKEDVMLMGCNFFESIYLNMGQLITQNKKCLKGDYRIGTKYIFNPFHTSLKFQITPHFPPCFKHMPVKNIDFSDLYFNHYKVNECAKKSIECVSGQKTEYVESSLMSEKASYLKSYNFIEKPQTQENFIDSEEDILGLDSFEWNLCK